MNEERGGDSPLATSSQKDMVSSDVDNLYHSDTHTDKQTTDNIVCRQRNRQNINCLYSMRIVYSIYLCRYRLYAYDWMPPN